MTRKSKDGGEVRSIAIKASDLIREFRRMLGWRYEWGAAREGCVDCSGAFAYAYNRLGGSMYHGSNTVWRKHTTEKGKVGGIQLLPGMAVFKWKKDGAPDSQGNYYHVGLYIGGGQVIEAQSASTGVVMSALAGWPYAARLKDTVYDLKEGDEPVIESECTATVITVSGKLNLRATAPDGRILTRIPQNAAVGVLRWDAVPGWALVLYDGTQGYVSQEFLRKNESEPSESAPKGCELRLPFEDEQTAALVLDALREAVGDAEIMGGN